MKKQNCSYSVVAENDIKAISTAIDPLNSTRLPIGVTLTCEPQLRLVKASGTLTSDWQAIMLVDEATDECYFVSPRVFLGLAFQNKKFTRLVDTAVPEKVTLMDFLKNKPKVVIERYTTVTVDVFQSDPLRQDSKEMPQFRLSIVDNNNDKPAKKAKNAK